MASDATETETKTETQAPSAPSNTAPLRPTNNSPGAFSAVSMRSTVHSPYLNALFYASHGSGKTTLGGSAVDVEEMRDVLVVTAEGGAVVFENNPRIKNWPLIDVIKIDRIEQFSKVYEWLKAHCMWRDNPEKEADLRKLQDVILPPEYFGEDSKRLRRYRTVIVDSLTEIEALNLSKILDLDKVDLDIGDEMSVAGWPEFRKNMHIILTTVRRFRDLPVNFLGICAQQWSQDERKAYHYSPKMTGKLASEVQGFFDLVGWLVPSTSVDQNTGVSPRRLFVQPQTAPKADAKCRLASYPKAFFDDPTMEDIMVGTGFVKRAKASGGADD